MAAKKAADSTLYHVAPRGVWKKFREVFAVDPEISSGLPIQSINRYPQPGSRPEKYNTPATKASDPAQNPYWKRDVRRVYPQLSVVDQTELSSLLIEHSSPPSLEAPSESKEGENKVVPAPKSQPLTASISTILSSTKVYTEDKLPPSLPTPFRRWYPERAPDAPHDPSTDFPMRLYK